jgi:serine/threonine-protein kinase
MLADDGRVKVVDFGIARASGAEAVTRSGLVLGSASYLSPEQAQGGSVDARSDVYALGCVLYEMLTGRPPFVADDPVAALYQHVNEQPMAPSAFRPVPREMEAIALRALEKDPARRYASADEMESALRSALAEADDPAATTPLSPVENVTTAPIAVTPASTARVTPHRARRRRFHGAASGHRWRVPALVVLGVVAAGLLMFLLFDRSDFPSRADLRAARIEARNEARADANAQNQQPEPTGPADPIPTVDEAYQGLIASITALAGDVESDVVEKLLDGANKILEEYQAGELAAVDDEIAHLREELVKMTSEAKIPAGSAETIGSALDQLVLAIAETPPPIVEGATGSGEEGSSHGGGEDHGNGPPPHSESGGQGGGDE